jgi:hypothetical protein
MNCPSKHKNMPLEILILEAKKTYQTYPFFYMSLITAGITGVPLYLQVICSKT